MMKKQDIPKKIIKAAETFIQTRGYNAFSYRDIALEVGVKTSSIHYHFPTKADLGKAVVEQHLTDLSVNLETLISNNKLSYANKLDLFFETIFEMTYLSKRKMCLGGMLASDVLTLPEAIQEVVRIFFDKVEKWLEQLLIHGIHKGEFKPIQDTKQEAAMILSFLEGALLLARLYQDEKRLAHTKRNVLDRLNK